MIKKSGIAALITTSMFTSICFAQIGTGDTGGIGDAGSIVASINAFKQDFNKKSHKVRHGYYNPTETSVLPPDGTPPDSLIFTPYRNNIQTANGFSTKNTASQNANTATSNNLENSLTQFNYELHKSKGDSIYPNELKFVAREQGSPGNYLQIPFAGYDEKNSLHNLINENPASDTLYMQQITIDRDTNLSESPSLLQKPTQINNNNFNFAALFEPTSYQIVKGNNGQPQNPQWKAATNFIVFAAQSTKNFADGLKLNALKGHAHALLKLKTLSTNYLKYAMTVRGLLAIRSITIDMLEHLIAERTPHPNWGAAIGDPNKDGTASPLQVEAYQANHRIDDPNWYSSIMLDAPITVQRTIAIELAEIEHQNYQAHLDRERILAALTATNLQSLQAANQELKIQIKSVNSDIASFVPKKK